MEFSTQVINALRAVCATEIAEVPGFLRDNPCETLEDVGAVHNSSNARLNGAVTLARLLAPGHFDDIDRIHEEAAAQLAAIYSVAYAAIERGDRHV